MSLRIGFDMDGVLADFSRAYSAIEDRLFCDAENTTREGGSESGRAAEEPDQRTAEQIDAEQREAQAERLKELRRRKIVVWQAIRNTPDFWLSLEPIDPGAVRRIHQLMLQHRWEVFFITQRPATVGETVQRQTQRWLVNQGFDMPSVLVVPASRGAAAAALSLDYHIDDSPKNCIDVKTESKAKPILIVAPDDEDVAASTRRLGIDTAASIAQALDVLEQARGRRRLLDRLARIAGLR
jgi:hypothetical protein